MQPKAKKSNNKLIGGYGEQISANWLKNKGFSILNLNYLKKWGEIDVVAKNEHKIHFVEVKTVSYETKAQLLASLSRETWQPENNVHPFKLKKLSRAIESWLMEYKYQGDWQIDVITVKLVTREKYARVKYLANIIL